MSNVIKLFDGDPRAQELFDELVDFIYEHARGMPIPLLLGILDLVKAEITHGAFCEACE